MSLIPRYAVECRPVDCHAVVYKDRDGGYGAVLVDEYADGTFQRALGPPLTCQDQAVTLVMSRMINDPVFLLIVAGMTPDEHEEMLAKIRTQLELRDGRKD